MNIIASIILAASVTWEAGVTNFTDYADYEPPTQTLEFEVPVCAPVESNVLAFTNTPPIVVTNEQWRPILGLCDDCYVRLTVTQYINLTHQLSVLWAEREERLANIERRKAKYQERQEAYAKSKSAVERVKENAAKRKRRSAIGRSLPTGGSKK